MGEKTFRTGKNIAVRSNLIVEAKYSLKGKENDIVDILLTQIEPDDKLEYEININKYKELYGYRNDKVVYRDLKEAVRSIETKRIYSYEISSKKSYAWFPKIEYVDNEGKIILEIHKDIKKAMVEYKNRIYYHIKYTLPLQGDYAKRFYYYAKSFAKSDEISWRRDKLDDLRVKLELDSKYPLYSDFKRFILNPVKEQINKKTDIIVEYEEERLDKTNKKRVTHIKTLIKTKTKEELNNINLIREVVDKPDNLREEILKLYNKYTMTLSPAEAKKKISEDLNITRTSVGRYLIISEKLIEPILKLLDEGKISFNEAQIWSKKDSDEQYKGINDIKLKSSTKKNTEKKTITVKEKRNIVDVTYTELKNEISVDLDDNKNIEIQTSIDLEHNEDKADDEKHKIKTYLMENKFTGITEEKVNEIYVNSEKNIEYVFYIINECKSQPKEIKAPLNWINKMVKPNVYQKSINPKLKQLKFDNFEGRDKTREEYEALEKKLLGWDDSDEVAVDESV